MKKILKFSLIAILLLSIFTTNQSTSTASTLVDDYREVEEVTTEDTIQPMSIPEYGWIVQSEMNRACGSVARIPNSLVASLPGTQSLDGTVPNKVEQEDLLERNTIEPLSSNYVSEIRYSNAGERIVLAFLPFDNYGYCHIYNRHMKESDGTKKKKGTHYSDKPSQFMYASFPDRTMDIVMEVVNGQDGWDKEVRDNWSKLKWSKTEQQNVKVIAKRGSKMAGTSFKSTDWVIISAYPFF
ncbi:hypothetical protein [Ureibacillus massiliensis]|uniref:hypothetical protein n=1 Tax=Ureibacillus massiliensis TaxID=292806 RepID=UPI00068D91F8|nr:hypothetical protein [Ureibacillus massiliensis]